MFDWNDLKYLLAVARCHSTIAAGKSLGLSQSTVHRRLSELERRLGRQLVVRQQTGYRLTPFGTELMPYAERAETAMQDIERRVHDVSRDLVGVIRLTCPEPIVARLTRAALFDLFHARHPGLRVEFVTSDRYVDLAKGEADVAFRSGDTDDELIGRKIAESYWAIYASADYVARHGRPETLKDLATHRLVALDERHAGHRTASWLAEIAPDATYAVRASSILGLVSAVKSGVGAGPLPTALGDAEPDLVRILGPIPELTRNWRILTLPDLRHTPRVSAFFDFILAESASLKAIFSG